MPAILERWANRTPKNPDARALGFADYLKLVSSFAFNGSSYTVGPVSRPGGDFEHLVREVHQEQNVVAAAVVARSLLLKQLKFAFRVNIREAPDYRRLFGTDALSVLEDPGNGFTAPQLLATAETHESYGGAAFIARDGNSARILAPDLVDVALAAEAGATRADLMQRRGSAVKIGYLYYPNGRDNPEDVVPFSLDEVAHWMPEPHPLFWWTGLSWVASVIPEVVTDKAAARYLQEHLGQGAMPAMVVKPHEMMSPEQIDEFADKFSKTYGGVGNAGKTMWLGAGSELTVVGSKIAELDLRNLTGGGETRVAMRARIPAAILGVRESLAGSSLNAGNYSSARRMFADGWLSPTAQDLCRALSPIIETPAGSELWYDPSDCLFLQEDAKDQADILQTQSAAIRQLVDGGFNPDSAVTAVKDNNLSALNHTGLTSVQLLPPATPGEPSNE